MTLPVAPPGWRLVLDTSAAQGPLDVLAVARAGVSALIAKATDGRTGVDPQWAATSAAARAAGLPFGAYGVLEPLADPRLQALHFVDTVRDSGACLFALDFELAAGETGLQALEHAVTWCETVEAELGRKVMVYCGRSFVTGLERLAGAAGLAVVSRLAQGRALWCSDYGSGHEVLDPVTRSPRLPSRWLAGESTPWPWERATIWQVGPCGATLPGARTPVDVDWCSEGDFAELFGP